MYKAFQKNYMKVCGEMFLRASMVPASFWRVHAVGIAPTERLKLRRQVAAAAGKKNTTSLSLFMEAFGHQVREIFSTLAAQYWAGVWTGKWYQEQREAWMKQVREVHTVPWNCGFRPFRFTLRLQPAHLFFFSFSHCVPRSLRRGLLLVLHLRRRLQAHLFHITCHGRRAGLNGPDVSSVIPMFHRSRSSKSLQHFRSFLSPSHLMSMCFFCTSSKASFALWSSNSLKPSKTFS